MSVIASSLSLPASSTEQGQQSQRQPSAPSRPRSSSNGDVSRPPPRYSSLAGTLPLTSAALAARLNAAQTDVAPPADLRPPRYSSVFNRTQDRPRRPHVHTASDSRVASSSSGPQVHEYHIKSGGKNWATLKVMSRTSVGSSSSSASSSSSTPSSTQRVPRFTSSDLVQGSLELNLETPQNINSITLSLRGRVIASSYEGGSYTFLDQPITSWVRTNGDPRSVSPTPDASTSSNTKKFDGKLSGNYNWPFSFPFPKEVAVGIQGQQSMYPTPQTFLEYDKSGSVHYELTLRLTHGILRSDSKLHANVVYVPDITPAPSSLLRHVAYVQNLIAPRPEVDPSGWHTLSPATVKGRLSAERKVKLQCTLSLANPQSYTRGTVIPCHIAIQSNDVQALDLVAKPKAIAVRLTRCVQHPKDPGQSGMPSTSFNGAIVEDKTEVERAVWWFNPEAEDQGVQVRHLEGEIHLEKELQPSCSFPLFKVSYTVELLPFEASVFRPAGSTITLNKDNDVSQIPLVSLPVIIATLRGEGPTPVTFTKPKPRSSRKQADSRTYKASTSMHAVSFY